MNDRKESITNQVIFSLKSDNFRTYNVELARNLGDILSTIVLQDLINQYDYYSRNQMLIDEEWFYYTHQTCEQRTAVTRKQLDRIMKVLIKEGFVDCEVRGLPAKRHMRLNFEIIHEKLQKYAQQVAPNGATGYPNRRNSSIYRKNSIKKKNNKKTRNSVSLSEQSFRLVDLFFQKMKENNPKAKPPDRDKSAMEIDRMHRLDGYSWEEIEKLICYSQSDSFWLTNILTPAKLRKQANQLTLKMKASHSNSSSEEKLESVEKNREWAKVVIDEILGSDSSKKARDWKTWCEVKVDGKWQPLEYTEHGFKDQFDNLLRKGGWIG